MVLVMVGGGLAQAKGKPGKGEAPLPPPPPVAELSVEEAPSAEALVGEAAAPVDPSAEGQFGEAAPVAEEAAPVGGGEPAPAPGAPLPASPGTSETPVPSLEAVAPVAVLAVPPIEQQTIAIDLRASEAAATTVTVDVSASPDPAVAPPPPAGVDVPPAPAPAPAVVDAVPELRVKSRKLPTYPPELELLYGKRTIRCEVLARIDRRGAPLRVAVDCPPGFHLAALDALRSWRWEKPAGAVPAEGVLTRTSIGFMRSSKRTRPGASTLGEPTQVTVDISQPVLLRSGAMPKYPVNVSYGNTTCVVELTVTKSGASKAVMIDQCSAVYRQATLKAVSGWKWYPAMEDGEAVSSQITVDVRFILQQGVYQPVGS